MFTSFYERGEGLCATEDIRAGENILEIPRRMLLDAGTICISEQGPFGDLLRILERCGADTVMTLWIMKERMKMKTKQETFWSLYFLSLPDGNQKADAVILAGGGCESRAREHTHI